MKISCVIVTYNRLKLLQESIVAVKKQSYPIDEILIVDNHSTDGTLEFLQTLANDKQIKIITLIENIGGAGGFSRGIKEAVMGGADWVWIMDDDTIPSPNALKHLVAATTLTEKVGYVCSKVLWTDGTPHVMNKADLKLRGVQYNRYSTEDIPAFLCTNATFVSVLFNAKAVGELGLPISEFFIWADDTEYTGRISSNNYDCFYVDNSLVTHKTGTNFKPHPDDTPAEMAWKFYYQTRNRIYINRQEKSTLAFYLSTLNMYRVYMRRINKRKDGNKKSFKKFVRKGFIDGLFKFFPKIEYI